MRTSQDPSETTDREIILRREALRQADANNHIEGITRDSRTDAIFDACVRGEFDASELVARIKAELKIA